MERSGIREQNRNLSIHQWVTGETWIPLRSIQATKAGSGGYLASLDVCDRKKIHGMRVLLDGLSGVVLVAWTGRYQNASPGTRTQPSMSTRALRLMTTFSMLHWPLDSEAAAPTFRVPEG